MNQQEGKFLKIPFTFASKGINLTKAVKDLYSENYKTLKKIEEDTISGSGIKAYSILAKACSDPIKLENTKLEMTIEGLFKKFRHIYIYIYITI